MSARTVVIPLAVVAMLGVGGLIAAGATDQRRTAFSIDVPALTPVATLSPGQEACQGPIDALTAFGGVQAWISPSAPPGAALRVRVRSGTTLATGEMSEGYRIPTSRRATLNATVPVGRRVSVCLRSEGPKSVTLLGSNAHPQTGTVSIAGKSTRAALALIFLRRNPKSLLSLLPAVFSRAALFRSGWVGAWTFWSLTGALLAAFALAAVAVVQAASSDIRSNERTSDQ